MEHSSIKPERVGFRKWFAELALALVVISIVQGVVFRDLIRQPTALVVDADRATADRYRIGPSPVGNDLTRLFLPHHLHVGREIAHLGRVPSWDDRGFCGRPLVGNPQASLFYPPVWLVWWANAPSGLGWLTFAHLLVLGLGGFWLGRTLGLSVLAALFAGICVSANPYVLAQAAEGHYPHLWSVSWFPWVIGLIWRGGRRSDAVAALLLALSFLAGHLQEWFYLNLASGLACGAALLISGPSALNRLSRLLLIWGFTLGLIAVELGPDLAVRGLGLLSDHQGLSGLGRYALGLPNLAQLADPFSLGGAIDYVGPGNFWETELSLGLVPLGLILVLLCDPQSRRKWRFWIAGLLLCLVFGAGPKLGLFLAAYYAVPWIDSFRVPARALFLALIPASILAGAGLDLVGRRINGPLPNLILVVLTFLSWCVSAWYGTARGASPEAWFWAFVFLVLVRVNDRFQATPTLKQGRFPRRSLWKTEAFAVVLALAGCVELVRHAAEIVVVSPVERWIKADPIGRAILADHGSKPAGPRIRADDQLYPDLNAALLGIEKANVGDSFQLERSARLYRRLYRIFDPHADDALPASLRPDDATLDHLARVVLNLLSIEYLVSGVPRPGLAEAWPTVASGQEGGHPFLVLRNSSALPRAYLVGQSVRPASVRNPVDDLLSLDPRSTVILDRDPPAPGNRQPFKPVPIESSGPDRLSLGTRLEGPGFLVTTIAWAPGWTATLNGNPCPILVGNLAFCTLAIEQEGEAHVELRYDPPGLKLGLPITLLTALLWCSWLLGRKKSLSL